MKAPFPFMGGKSTIAQQVWERFGDVRNFIEPFCGTCAVLLKRPRGQHGYETVNDANGFITNFWRAVQRDPEAVAWHAYQAVHELDLHAWHTELRRRARDWDLHEYLRLDPHYYEVEIAGRWCWGQCLWIGGGWCATESRQVPQLSCNPRVIAIGREYRSKPSLSNDRGVVAVANGPPSQAARPHLSRDRGLLTELHKKRPRLDAEPGIIDSDDDGDALVQRMHKLAERLRDVRILCGDWSRVCTPAVTTGCAVPCGVFLDPPYSAEADRDMNLYAHESGTVAHEVWEWAIVNGNNPDLRIALCGYEGEHVMPEDWECLHWKAAGGMANIAKDADSQGRKNRHRERIWFSPHCMKPGLF